MKKIVSVILSLAMVLAFIPSGLFTITASAATASGRCGETANWTINTSTGKLDITGAGQIGPYGSYYKYGPHDRDIWSSGSYTYLQNIKDVYIGEGIASIATEMFYAHWNNGKPTYINNLKSIHFPTTLEYIAYNTFYTSPDVYISDLSSWCKVDCCDQIGTIYLNNEAISEELKIPDSVTKIGQGVFYNQKGITSVDIPSNVAYIGKNAFDGSTNLKEAIVSGNCPITADCKLDNIVDLEIRGDIDTVNSSFNNLKELQKINIKNGIETISSDSFNGCSKLTQVSLTNSVKKIGANAFNGCDNLTDIYFDGTILEWIDIVKDSGNTVLNSATIHCSKIADINDSNPSVSNVIYNSDEQTPTVTIAGLTESIDFTVEYSNNINVGTADVIIKGINTCSGEKRITFEILQADISNAIVTGVTDKTFTSDKITQYVIVEMFDDTLIKDVDYTIDYTDNTNVGKASIAISGMGNYCGVWQNSFNIGCKDISSAVVENIEDKTFDYEYFTQKNVSVSVDDILLVKDKDYTVSYKSNYSAGTASVIITGKGNYTGTITRYFRINPRDINEASISGVLYSKDYDTTAQTQNPTLTYKGQALNSGDFKITYTNNTNCGTATMTITGKNNFIGSFTVEFEIAQANIEKCEISGITSKEYTGEEITQNAIKVYIDGNRLVENTHYTVSYDNNVQIGTARVKISGIGNCKGTITKEFSIEKKTKAKAPSPTLIRMTISSIEVQHFDGMEYKIGDGEWQSSSIFNGLTEGVTYKIYQRWAETDIYKASPASAEISVLAAHTYDNACDKECNICGFVRTVPEHVYTDDCDEYCNVCGFKITPKHYYEFNCSTACSKCDQTRKAAEHTYDNACDIECNICCETRTITHTHQIKNIWSFDKTHHWEKCYICGNETTKQSHVYTGETDTTCNTCGYTRLLENVASQAHLTTVPKGYKGIYTYSDLLSINNNPSGKYILMADIDASLCTKSVVIEKEFTGVLNGNGYSINNFTFDSEVTSDVVLAVGIFMKNSGVICNLTITNFGSVVSIKHEKATAFIGVVASVNNGTIRNCSIINSNAFCSGNKLVIVGGIVATNNSTGVIEYCNVTKVTSDVLFFGASTNSYSSIEDSALYCGGISGTNDGTIRCCYSTTYLTVGESQFSLIGGISGDNNGGNISDCYSSSTIMFDFASTRFGGIAGYNDKNSTIQNTYFSGYCTQANNSNYRVRLITRQNAGTITNSYVYSDFLASAAFEYGTNCTSSQFAQQSTFAGYDFTNVWVMGSSKPQLRAYNYSVCIEDNAHTGGLNCCCAAKICEVCGTVYGETGDHIYSEWQTVYDGVCPSKGMNVKTCLYCGDEIIDNTIDGEHVYDNDSDMICNGCGYDRSVPDKVTSDKVTVGETTISKITAGTTVEAFVGNLNEGEYCKVFKGDNEVDSKSAIGTGMKVKIMDGDTVKAEYTVIVTGDTNGDGAISVTDMISIKSHILGKSTLSNEYATAADTSGDSGISITDFIQIKAKILGKGDIIAK